MINWEFVPAGIREHMQRYYPEDRYTYVNCFGTVFVFQFVVYDTLHKEVKILQTQYVEHLNALETRIVASFQVPS